MHKWQIQHSTTALDTAWFRIRRDECQRSDGHIIPDYYVYESVPVAIIFAVTPAHEVLFVEQYRHGWGDVMLELPAGMCESADPLHDAQRELLEETGYASSHWQPLARYIANPTRANNEVYTFLALDVSRVAEQTLDSDEAITVHRLPLDSLLETVDSGRVRVLDSVLTIYAALRRLGRV